MLPTWFHNWHRRFGLTDKTIHAEIDEQHWSNIGKHLPATLEQLSAYKLCAISEIIRILLFINHIIYIQQLMMQAGIFLVVLVIIIWLSVPSVAQGIPICLQYFYVYGVYVHVHKLLAP